MWIVALALVALAALGAAAFVAWAVRAAAPRRARRCFDEGVAALRAQRHAEAIVLFDRLLRADPGHAQAHYRRATALLQLQRHEQALAGFDAATRLDPALADAHYNRGLALQALKRPQEALACYDAVLALQPGDAEAHNNRGNALLELRRHDEALASYRRAAELQPRLVDAQHNIGVVCQELRRPDEAAQAYERVLALRGDHPYAIGRLLHARMLGCDWRDHEALCTQVDQRVMAGEPAAEPFGYLASAPTPAHLQRAARRYAQEYRVGGVDGVSAAWRGAPRTHDKIRLGYLSGDFRHQATSILAVELFERHDKARFELVAFDTGWSDRSAIRRRLEAAFDTIVDVSAMSDDAAAAEMRRREIDIAVDLNGYFGLGRPGILARRPCPVQVNYLGYPGTLGAAHMDYIVADAVLIPPGDDVHYDERVVRLPGCYQANDGRRRIADAAPARAQAGLPDDAFVFCCFNNNFKITPQVFAVWMRLLQRVDGSVLWLLRDNATAAANLQAEAARHGVAPGRIVFAERVPPDAHLARHRLADLFLDTLPCNAHTTASDALWAGLPLLSCAGKTFPGRVAASLLHAAGLPELVAGSLPEYEARAVELASSPQRLAELRAHLARQRHGPPFDAASLCRGIETAYERMWALHRQALPPEAIDLQGTAHATHND